MSGPRLCTRYFESYHINTNNAVRTLHAKSKHFVIGIPFSSKLIFSQFNFESAEHSLASHMSAHAHVWPLVADVT